MECVHYLSICTRVSAHPMASPLALSLFSLLALTPLAQGQSFEPQQAITTSADYAKSVFAVDLDGDGDADVLTASSIATRLRGTRILARECLARSR